MATLTEVHNNNSILKTLTPSFRLPQEHGATIAFICSSLLGIVIARDNVLLTILSMTMLWSLLLSWHKPKQLVTVTILGCILMICTDTPYLLVGLLVLFPVTGWYLLKKVLGISPELRECIGMLGATNIPILASLLISNNTQAVLLASCALTASTLTCAGMIRFKLNGSLKKTILSWFCAVLAWIIFFVLAPQLAFFCSIFFAFFQLWLKKQNNLNFKTLGIYSTSLAILTTLAVSAELLP
jgi:hypothetical protein